MFDIWETDIGVTLKYSFSNWSSCE